MKKNIFLAFLAAAFLIGCSNSPQIPQIPLRTSEPIFIEESPKNNLVFVRVINEKGRDSEAESQILARAMAFGYMPSDDEIGAGVRIKIFLDEINVSKQRYYRRDPFECSPFFGCKKYDPFWDEEIAYIYDAQASLQIKVNSGKKTGVYVQNLNFKSELTNYSYQSVKTAFKTGVAKKTASYLNGLLK